MLVERPITFYIRRDSNNSVNFMGADTRDSVSIAIGKYLNDSAEPFRVLKLANTKPSVSVFI